jgi:hypothetical protein
VALVTRYDTPAGLRDLQEGSTFYEAWHDFVDGEVSATFGGPWIDPTVVDAEVITVRSLSWIGFPRASLTVDRRDDRPSALADAEGADQGPRGRQFEYFEWHATRDAGDRITKVAFSTETPEYWELLAEADQDRVVSLYREHVDPSVQWDELTGEDGTYDRRNRWTTTDGIMHLVNGINEVRQAIGLAKGGAAATVTEPVARDNFEMPAVSANAADDYIIREVAVLGRCGFDITVHDPVGLYIDGWDDSGWTKPDGTPVGDYWRITRGRRGAALRVEYEVPPEEGFVVGDIRIGGRPVTNGGQLAEHMTSALPVLVARRPS